MIMNLLLSFLLAAFATTVMSYISMATGIGPWIAPTLALAAMPFFRILRNQMHYVEQVSLVTAAGSIGGILATGMGFSLPTLYFLDKGLFNAWMAQPFYFVGMLAALSVTAGAFGLWIANIVQHRFIEQEQLPFPIGELVYKMIAVQNNVKKAWELFIGFIGTAFFCIFQDGIGFIKGFLPKAITLVPALQLSMVKIPLIRLDIWPMVWAIGFVTGHVIAVPLAAGALAKIFLIDPANSIFFPTLSNMEFILAFCSGMVISGTLLSFLDAPKLLAKTMRKIVQAVKAPQKEGGPTLMGTFISWPSMIFQNSLVNKMEWVKGLTILLTLLVFLTYLQLPLLAQLYLIIFTFMCTYEIASQAGKIGLARLGMFATFVMVPAMLLFNLTMTQIVFIAAFVEICGGVAADVLFSRKLAQRASLDQKRVELYQWFGLLISSLTVGVVFWLLIKQFGLGSPELFAYKAQNRQLLIAAQNFNIIVLLLGGIFGLILKRIKINASLVLGGILMPLSISLGLIAGGLTAWLTKDKENWYPFWSGVFASNSVWMLLKAML